MVAQRIRYFRDSNASRAIELEKPRGLFRQAYDNASRVRLPEVKPALGASVRPESNLHIADTAMG